MTMTHILSRGLSPHATKSGPGRRHSQGKSTRSYSPNGGNWQGTEYLSYAEHDQCVRATFGSPHDLARKLRYDVEKRSIVASR